MTIDEELTVLETQLRRLKIEYEVFFNNPTKKPPNDVEWKVLSILRKLSDGVRMSFPQRYRYNEIAQRYAVYSDLWRKKKRIREEGYRRPQDALLSIQGVRLEEEIAQPERRVYGLTHVKVEGRGDDEAVIAAVEEQPVTVLCSDARAERTQVAKLYRALTDAKKKSGEPVASNFDNFSTFVQKKTDQIRKQYGCHSVEYTVEMQDGQVKLKAKAKV